MNFLGATLYFDTSTSSVEARLSTRLVMTIWFLVVCSWFLVLGSLFPVLGSLFLVPYSWFFVPGSLFLLRAPKVVTFVLDG
jgi:hypothetical protein